MISEGEKNVEGIEDLKIASNKNNDIFKTDVAIFKTTNYSRFKFSALNRVPNHSNNIIKSIQKNDFTAYNPILVTVIESGDFIIIDGQNRFLACQKLGLPIYFIVSGEASIEDAPTLNSASRNWSGMEYIEHYAKRGDKNYIKLLELHKRYNAPLASLIKFASKQRNSFVHLKDGTLQLNETRDLNSLCEHWLEIIKYVPFTKNEKFLCALAVCFYNEKYDSERMLSRLKVCSGIILQQPTNALYRKEIEKVYNYGVKHDKIVRFID